MDHIPAVLEAIYSQFVNKLQKKSYTLIFSLKVGKEICINVLNCVICFNKYDMTCSICVDVVTDIDNFITSETTEQQIVEFVEQVSNIYW